MIKHLIVACLVVFCMVVVCPAAVTDLQILTSDIITEGEYGRVDVYDTPPDMTILDISGNVRILGSLTLNDSCTVNVDILEDNNIDAIDLNNQSTLNLFLGRTNEGIIANDASTVNRYGGLSFVDLNDSAILNIYGGTGGYNIDGQDAFVHIYGSDFSTVVLPEPDEDGAGYISGILSDGTSFKHWFGTTEELFNTRMHPIPEPTSLMLMGLGFLIASRKTK